jgi:hypothetical protein
MYVRAFSNAAPKQIPIAYRDIKNYTQIQKLYPNTLQLETMRGVAARLHV